MPEVEPDLVVHVTRKDSSAAEVLVFVRDAPGPLEPPPDDRERVAEGPPEIGPVALRDADTLKAYLEQLTRSAASVRAWCYRPRAGRMLELIGAENGATDVSIDVRVR